MSNMVQKEAGLFHQRPTPIIGKAVPTPIGSMNYNVLRALLEEGNFLQLNRGAEIGVFEAATSEHLLSRFPNLTLLCVDPYLGYERHESDKTQAVMSDVERRALERLRPFGQRANHLRFPSTEAAQRVPDGSLDFVFIDAIHTYEAVLEDLRAWFPKVRPGGLVSGHDVSWSGILEAVESFIQEHRKAAFYTPSTSDVWFFVK